MVRLPRLADRERAVPVLFVSYSGLVGGAERLLLDAASALVETPALACPEGPLADSARGVGLHVLTVRQRPLELRGRRAAAAVDLFGLGRELAAIVDGLQPDVVYAWGMRALLAAVGLPRRSRLAFQHND